MEIPTIPFCSCIAHSHFCSKGKGEVEEERKKDFMYRSKISRKVDMFVAIG